jgi:hypothetical protein
MPLEETLIIAHKKSKMKIIIHLGFICTIRLNDGKNKYPIKTPSKFKIRSSISMLPRWVKNCKISIKAIATIGIKISFKTDF